MKNCLAAVMVPVFLTLGAVPFAVHAQVLSLSAGKALPDHSSGNGVYSEVALLENGNQRFLRVRGEDNKDGRSGFEYTIISLVEIIRAPVYSYYREFICEFPGIDKNMLSATQTFGAINASLKPGTPGCINYGSIVDTTTGEETPWEFEGVQTVQIQVSKPKITGSDGTSFSVKNSETGATVRGNCTTAYGQLGTGSFKVNGVSYAVDPANPYGAAMSSRNCTNLNK